MTEAKNPHLAEFKHRYKKELRPIYKKFGKELRRLLKKLTKKAAIPVINIEHRTKTVESFLKKIEKKKCYDNPFEQIKDCAGLRVTTYSLSDVERVTEMVRKEFDIDEEHSENKVEELRPKEFGYRSVHLIISLSKDRVKFSEWKHFSGLPAEIQVRSILEHAWANLSHRLHYKTPFEAPRLLQRRLFGLSALLELADREFKGLQEEVEKITKSYKNRLDRGELDLPLDLDSLWEFMDKIVDSRKWEEFGVQAGMGSPEPVRKFRSTDLVALLLTLRTIGIPDLAGFKSLFPGFEKLEGQVRKFVDLVTESGDKAPRAFPEDVLVILVSLSKPNCIPSDFDWGEGYNSSFIEALREVCKQQ